MKVTYLGTNTLLFNKDHTAILVDPHFTRPAMRDLLKKINPDPQVIAENLARFGIHRLDGVLLTHTHYDHALDAVEVTRQTGAILYGSESAANLALAASLDPKECVQVIPGQIYHIGDFQVRFHHARHIPFPAPLGWLMPAGGKITRGFETPAWFWKYQAGVTCAIQVDRTLIFGSAGFVAGVYENLDIETVILGVGGLDVKSPGYIDCLYRETVLAPGAKQVFLSHWDNFFRPVYQPLRPLRFSKRSLAQISARGAQCGQTVQQLEYGRSYEI